MLFVPSGAKMLAFWESTVQPLDQCLLELAACISSAPLNPDPLPPNNTDPGSFCSLCFLFPTSQRPERVNTTKIPPPLSLKLPTTPRKHPKGGYFPTHCSLHRRVGMVSEAYLYTDPLQSHDSIPSSTCAHYIYIYILHI